MRDWIERYSEIEKYDVSRCRFISGRNPVVQLIFPPGTRTEFHLTLTGLGKN